MDALGAYLGIRYAAVLLQPSTGEIEIDVAQASPRSERRRRARYKQGEGITARSLRPEKPLVIPDVSKEPNYLNRTGRGKDPNKAFICVPILNECRRHASSADELDPSEDNLKQDQRVSKSSR